MGYLNPNFWHDHTLDFIQREATTRRTWVFRSPILMGSNLVAIGTGAAAALSQLLKLILIQPLGMPFKASLGIVRVITWSEFGSELYNSLPGITAWLYTAKKIAILVLGIPLSALSIPVSLFTPKMALWNSRFQAKTYAQDKEFENYVKAANNLPSLALIQTYAETAKDLVFSFEKKALQNQLRAKNIASSAKDLSIEAFGNSLERANLAAIEAEKEALAATEKALELQTWNEKAQIKLKANQADSTSVNQISRQAKEAIQTAETVKSIAQQARGFSDRVEQIYSAKFSEFVAKASKLPKVETLRENLEEAVETLSKMSEEAENEKNLAFTSATIMAISASRVQILASTSPSKLDAIKKWVEWGRQKVQAKLADNEFESLLSRVEAEGLKAAAKTEKALKEISSLTAPVKMGSREFSALLSDLEELIRGNNGQIIEDEIAKVHEMACWEMALPFARRAYNAVAFAKEALLQKDLVKERQLETVIETFKKVKQVAEGLVQRYSPVLNRLTHIFDLAEERLKEAQILIKN